MLVRMRVQLLSSEKTRQIVEFIFPKEKKKTAKEQREQQECFVAIYQRLQRRRKTAHDQREQPPTAIARHDVILNRLLIQRLNKGCDGILRPDDKLCKVGEEEEESH